MTDQLQEPWRMRIRGSGNRIVGAGVLVAPDLMLTCAHVVARALGTPADGPRPLAPVTVDFPTNRAWGRCAATVLEHGWLPMTSESAGDLALLRLERAAELPSATFAACGAPWRREVRVFGHPPANAEVGEWATAEMTGTAGPLGEWMQINGRQTGPLIVGGYSGAGVVDPESRSVIGLLIAADRSLNSRGAWMVTAEAMVRLLPALREAVGELRAPAPRRRTVPPSQPDPGRLRSEMQIVEALLRQPGIDERTRRDEFVFHVERRLDRPLGASRDERARSDLLNVVVACLDRPELLGALAIAEAADLVWGDTPASRGLRLITAGHTGRRLTDAEIDRLDVVIGNQPPEAVVAAASASFGVMGQPGDVDPANGADLIRALVDLSGRPGEPPPLLAFLQRLARDVPEDGHILIEWRNHIAAEWGLASDELTAAEDEEAGSTPERSSLVVDLQSDMIGANTYLLSISLEHDRSEGIPLWVDDHPLTLDEVPGHVGVHLRRVAAQSLGPVGALTIEFVLPYELLSHPVDQWRISANAEPLPLGAQYSVVIRSRDRIHSTIYHHRWEARWRSLKRYERMPHGPSLHFVRFSGSLARSLPSGLTDEFPVCLVLALPTGRRKEVERVNALRHVVETGMPVVLWCRLPMASEQFILDMANHLRNRPVGDVPEVIQRLRQDATVRSQPINHLGQHICLLWDDYDRLAPPTALRAPAPEGGTR